MTSKHKMAADSMGTFVRKVLGEMAVCYVTINIPQQGQGVANMLYYKTNVHGFASIAKLKSSFVLWDYFTSPYHANYPFTFYYPMVPCCEICKQSSF